MPDKNLFIASQMNGNPYRNRIQQKLSFICFGQCTHITRVLGYEFLSFIGIKEIQTALYKQRYLTDHIEFYSD
jgi:hypothetical protein